MRPVFISGIGTGIGKTLVSAVITEALRADYWKPVQAGFEGGTDSQWVRSVIQNTETNIHPETYRLKMAASPHIAAARENRRIEIASIISDFQKIHSDRPVVIEGAGGLLVPLNESDFVIDLIKELDAVVVLVSRHYLGSINHSLMTATCCQAAGIEVAGWVFNDQYLDYAEEIVQWTGYPTLFTLPRFDSIHAQTIQDAAVQFQAIGKSYLYPLL